MQDKTFWLIVIAATSLSVISAAFLLVWFFKKHPIKTETVRQSARDTLKPDRALKRHRFFAVCWPLLCIVFSGIIVYQSIQGMDERFAGDAGFALIPLVFFAIGMSMRGRLLKERRNAVILTKATVVSSGRRMRAGKRYFFPEYEFQAGDNMYRVKSPGGYSVCYLGEGREVDLYYAPENPKVFYVPAMQKHEKRWAGLLCGVGILWPLIGLLAPQIRALLWFLEETG